MNILVIGSGGREHAICSAFAKSSRTDKIYCAPGNAGIADIAECLQIQPEDIDGLIYFARNNSIDLTFVGGETALSLGIVDEFENNGLRIIGCSRSAARLEASKSFAKDFMKRHGIPTAKYLRADSPARAVKILKSGTLGDASTPVVVKADGLAAGKGVVVAKDRAEAIAAIKGMKNLVGADAASIIVLEECLFGREVSLILFSDGKNFALMPPTRDYKRIGDGDTGPNTGGMGTITDSSLLTDAQTKLIIDQMINPTLQGCVAEGFAFRGILFLGIMLAGVSSPHVSKCFGSTDKDDAVPMLLEYNVRFGDPETQSILVRLETDLVDICQAMLEGTLDRTPISWRNGNSATVVLASKGYPEKPQTGSVIHGLQDKTIGNISIFHAGTAKNYAGDIVTAGGRVLGITAVADNLNQALTNAYSAVELISWDGMHYRRDIGE